MSRVAPWASWAEFHGVFLQLTSSQPGERARGVKRVETWRTRCRLPVAVDVTASFVEIMLNDAYLNPEAAAPRSDHELRLMYAMAVVRLVNGIVDVSRTGRTTILARAQSAEWPQLFVDLRHEASHQNLPSLPILRLAAQEAVWLLVERYWRPQLQKIEERGRNGTSQTADRGAKTLDRKLKALMWCTAATCAAEEPSQKRRKFGNKMKAQEDQDSEAAAREASLAAKKAAEDVSGMAADESKLLARVFQVLEGEPHADGRDSRALHLLCQTCSENFALRLLRHLLFAAAGLPTVKLEGAADNCPSLRNISDHYCSAATEPGMKEHSSEDSERMLHWLWALLSNDTPDKDSGSSSRLRCTLASLLPSLRLAVVGHMASSSGSDVASRSSRLWAALREERLDAGAEMFSAICEALDPTSGLSSRDSPSQGLEEMEGFVKKAQSKPNQKVGREPWTAVGTVFDRNLSIRCREEHPEKMPLSADALRRWMDWAAVDFYAMSKLKNVITAESCQIDIPVTENHDAQPDAGGIPEETTMLPDMSDEEILANDAGPEILIEKRTAPSAQADLELHNLLEVEEQDHVVAIEPDVFRQLAAEALAQAEISNT